MKSTPEVSVGSKSGTAGPDTNALEVADYIGELMLEKHAEKIVIMDLRGITSMTDGFIICTGGSQSQVKAIADHIDDSLRESDTKPYHIEGYEGLSWVVIDYVHLVVHIFLPKEREYYEIERLWDDAIITTVEDEA